MLKVFAAIGVVILIIVIMAGIYWIVTHIGYKPSEVEDGEKKLDRQGDSGPISTIGAGDNETRKAENHVG